MVQFENAVSRYRKMILDELKEKDIPFNVINENPPFFKSDARKIYFNILLDDRAGLKSAFEQLTEVIRIIKNDIQ